MNSFKNGGRLMHALVIDDSSAMKRILSRILKGIGFEISEASDGQEALACLEQLRKPDLVRVDWNMPKMNGFEFVRSVRSNPAYDNVRLMMVTTEITMGQVSKALEAGANEYVMKPFTKDVILEKLKLIGFHES